MHSYSSCRAARTVQGATTHGTNAQPIEATDTAATERIPVTVHADDPISWAGAVSHLKKHAIVDIVDQLRAHAEGVVVVLAESLDEPTLSRLRVLGRSEGVHVVLVAGSIRETELLDVAEFGVGAIVWRHEATEHELLRAVVAAFRGDAVIPSELVGQLIGQVGRLRRDAPGTPGVPSSHLTPREIDILRLVAEGRDTAEIGRKISYSERTVKNVIQGVTTRLHLRNRAHAVAYALREGFI